MLAPSLNGLVVGDTRQRRPGCPTAASGTSRTTPTGTENVVIDPVKKTREVVATPPAGGQAGGGRGRPRRPRRRWRRPRRRARWRRRRAHARPADPTSPARPAPPPPSMSPDGTKAAVHLRLESLGARRRHRPGAPAHDRRRRRTSATRRATPAGRRAPRRRCSWSPDGKKIATQQQDERKVGDMYLVETPVNGGHPVLRAWKYPLPGDPVVAMISRVIIDVDTGKMTRLQMPPDFHRAMSETTSTWATTSGARTASQLGFVSTDRFHKNSTRQARRHDDRRSAHALHRDREDARADARAVADPLGHERGALVLAARRTGAAVSLRSQDRHS